MGASGEVAAYCTVGSNPTETKILKSVNLFDVYVGDKLPEGKKSYALSFILEDNTKTLTDKYIDKVMNKLISSYETKVGAEVRSK